MKILTLLLLLFSFDLFGQYLNIETEFKLGTGIYYANAYNEVDSSRTRTYIQTDVNFFTDNDRFFQYGISAGTELETRLAFFPGAFIKIEKENKFGGIFVLSGFEYMIKPETSFGFRFGIGGNYKITNDLRIIIDFDIKPHLFGEDLPNSMIVYFNLLIGIGFTF